MINKKFKEINTTYTQANIDGIFYYAVFFPVVEIISAASLGFMVWWGAQGVLDQTVTIGQLVAFPMFLTRLFQPIRMLADKFNSLQMGLIASNRIFDTLDHSENDLNVGTIAPNSIKGDIQFENNNLIQVDLENIQGFHLIKLEGKNLKLSKKIYIN